MPPVLSETVLPNGMRIFCRQKYEVAPTGLHIEGYFRHGIGLREGDTVFDVGANIGAFTLAAFERCNHNVTVYAFEPIPAIFDVLQRNARRYDSGHYLKVFPYGLSRECGPMTFAYYPHLTTVSTAYPEGWKESLTTVALHNLDEAPSAFLRWFHRLPLFLRLPVVNFVLSHRLLQMEPVTCQVETLSHFVQEHDIRRIDLLKIDVEKSELDVISGIEDRDWPKIKQMVVEVHDTDHAVEKVKAMLKARGFGQITVEQDPGLKRSNVYNLYALRRML